MCHPFSFPCYKIFSKIFPVQKMYNLTQNYTKKQLYIKDKLHSIVHCLSKLKNWTEKVGRERDACKYYPLRHTRLKTKKSHFVSCNQIYICFKYRFILFLKKKNHICFKITTVGSKNNSIVNFYLYVYSLLYNKLNSGHAIVQNKQSNF